MPLSRRALSACLMIAGCAGVLVCFRWPDAPGLESRFDVAAMKELSRLGEGLLVWERYEGKSWQIWTKNLDGSGEERRLVPEEAGRDHFCPKLSLDGSQLAYMSYERGQTPYDSSVGTLWLLDIKTGHQTILTDKARSYYEDRAVIWYDDHRLCHVDEKGRAVELDISTGARRVLTVVPPRKHGWLVNAQQTHVTSGDPEFALMGEAGAVQTQPKHGGCQPYFSQDGKWGFWMGGAGGPINKMFLPTRAVGQVLDLNDPRMPKERNYLYFPMLSSCQRIMAYAASKDAHDHFGSDYDIYLIRVDAATLDPIGKPVRYTSYEGNDRFPDVYCTPLPLGSHFVEGPSRIALAAPSGESCQWWVNGVAAGEGRELVREYEAVGDHWVMAKLPDGQEVRGLVHVRAPHAPALTLTRRLEDGSLQLTFDEAVSLRGATARTMDGSTLAWGEQAGEGCLVRLPLPDGMKSGGHVMISGIQDLAQKPNVMPSVILHPPGAQWPQSREGLLLAWENNKPAAITMMDDAPVRTGKAFWNSSGGMDMRGGSFEIPHAGTAMLQECSRSGAFTMEAIITPMVPPYDKTQRPVFSLENEQGNVKLALLQLRSEWSLWLATKDNPEGTGVEQPLTPFKTGQPHHIVLSYQQGRFQLLVNGSQLWVRPQVHEALAWNPGTGRLRFGACSKISASWLGMVEQLSIHSRVLTPSEAMAHADYAAPKVEAQRAVKTRKVVARLVQTSRLPTLQEITPYREALVQQLYEVLPKDEGDNEQSYPVGSKMMVTHWSLVNGESAVMPPAKVGDTYRLFVEPKDAHAELKSLVERSDLPLIPEVLEMVDVSNW